MELAPGAKKEVVFEVRLKAALKVEIYCEIIEGKRELFTGLEVKVTTACGLTKTTKTGIADFGKVPTREYKVKIEFVVTDQNVFDLRPRASDTITLDPGKAGKLEFDVDPLYRKVHFVAHCLLTIPKPYWTGNKLPLNLQGPPPIDLEEQFDQFYDAFRWKSAYNGRSFATDEDDINARVALMTAVINAAEAKIVKRHDEIKGFIMPECYFIPKNGGYQYANLSVLTRALLTLTSDPKWKHWVFICGTVNSYKQTTELFNMSPAIRGGGADEATYLKLIRKFF